MSKIKNNRNGEKSIQKKTSNLFVHCAWMIGVVSSAADVYQILQHGFQLVISVV